MNVHIPGQCSGSPSERQSMVFVSTCIYLLSSHSDYGHPQVRTSIRSTAKSGVLQRRVVSKCRPP